MDLSPALPPDIAEALAQGATVLTANQRAARTLHHAFNQQQRALGLTSWPPAAILSWDAWLSTLWHRLLIAGQATDLLLNNTQELSLWRAIIAADPANTSPIEALAHTASEAWHLVHQHRARKHLSTYASTTDTRAFARWAADFDRRAARSHYLTLAQLPETILTAIAAAHLTLPPNLHLIGFDTKTPAQQSLLEAIQSTGTQISEPTPTNPGAPFMQSHSMNGDHTPNLTLTSTPDDLTELTACAHWLRTHLTQHPTSRIAVILPAIDPIRPQIDRIFRSILAPELNNIASTALPPYEFSLGLPLAHTPLASTAFDILRWAISPLPIDRISTLLLSPHFASARSTSSEPLTRAEFDAFILRRQHLLQPELSLPQLHRLAARSGHAADLTTLLKHLDLFATSLGENDLTKPHTYADWAALFHQLLEAAGWATPTHLDSAEFQTLRKWQSAFDELTTLDFDAQAPQPTFTEALAALERIARSTLFAPESRHAPIQIMGALESAGSTFDALWFLRANDLTWPATPSPNPLLPWALQRDLQMPGADPANDTAHAQRITQRVASSAPEVVFSYAIESASGNQRPSPTLATFNLTPSHIPAPPPTQPLIKLESFPDAEPIPPPPDRVLQGGAAILQAQAACGFRAFAELRLYASALEPIALGLSPAERGSLIHAALEDFWSQIPSQTALKALTTDQRNTQLTHSINAAFQKHHARPSAGWPHAYLSTERDRIHRLLSEWLNYEANQRAPFVVKAREQELHDVRIGPLRLDIRVDRIDTIDLQASEDPEADPEATTAEIILDYKTGLTSPNDWLTPRPDQPQLPLYAVVADSANLAAIAFATLRPGKEMNLHGLESQPGILPKSPRRTAQSFAAQLEQWRETLTILAEDFHSGHAHVSPKLYPQTCTYCAQRLLCRLDLSTLESIDEETDPTEDPTHG
ncbi:MAG TPA: PD-(D/E)XK nuclease family protein [Acidobacteriaceae bacterium]|nr:PD-(D/E)XK nuclease family protein [Acidobacteriaceae bacterium]